MSLSGRVALVTGASRGIGRACALGLLEDGLRVAIGYREDKDGAHETAAGAAAETLVVRIDVTNPESVESAFDEVRQRFGAVEVLVNNAGVRRDRVLIRMKEEDWEEVVATNLTGVFRCTKRALPGMLAARWGRVITIGSVAGTLGNAGQANYSAAKAGVVGFTKALAREVASKGITANVVVPGLVETGMVADLNPAARENLLKRIPIGRPGTPEEAAEAVRYCARASYVNGQTIVVDGGLS
ncbi:MAG: 3-oxoacyl-ACP reductase family protein [Actinomycetota bacterium]